MAKISLLKDRILTFIQKQRIKKVEFYSKTGISPSNFKGSGLYSEIGGEMMAKIVSAYPSLDANWLLTGEGEMIRGKGYGNNDNFTTGDIQFPSGKERIPLISIDAIAKYTSGDISITDNELIEIYDVPDFNQKEVKYMIRISGNSMYPRYSSGDILACRPITNVTFFQWGKVYVLNTDQGSLVKRLYQGESDKYIECRSDNKEQYPPFQILKESIRSISIVVGVIRLE